MINKSSLIAQANFVNEKLFPTLQPLLEKALQEATAKGEYQCVFNFDIGGADDTQCFPILGDRTDFDREISIEINSYGGDKRALTKIIHRANVCYDYLLGLLYTMDLKDKSEVHTLPGTYTKYEIKYPSITTSIKLL